MPKRVMSQTSEGLRKKSSRGMSLGMATREEAACTVKERARPMGMRRKSVAAGGGGVPAEAVEEGSGLPEQGEEERRRRRG